MDYNLNDENAFNHETLSIPNEFISFKLLETNDVYHEEQDVPYKEEYKPENHNDAHEEIMTSRNMLFGTDNIELPPSIINLLDDFPNLPTPESFSNLFQEVFPTIDMTETTTDTTAVDESTTPNDVDQSDLDLANTNETSRRSQVTIVMLPFQISTLINTHSYPPTNMVGSISEHDRPYSKYGHLDANILHYRFCFDICGERTLSKRLADKCRIARKMFAIICHTNISKEEIIMELFRQYPLALIQYICISSNDRQHRPRKTANMRSTYYIQIIFKRTLNKKIWFLDAVTGDECNYDVTSNDMAWNEFIKKNRNFIEIGEFLSSKIRSRPEMWSSCEFIRSQKNKRRN
ncbi:unnamed protein product [Rotaria sp. Silwood2]|nr:unnamed protein product [Rotaria sp. Silwood2]CAF3303535.1 unnamed protein product [Rotaria sp. Silwood2]CAF4052713.1 unnamed protein product [Rotaria sp. Silwood2]CAF4092531.1 unnamed protein product [Rotaria sp. Silwood2]CAF4471232.1 unnamed protein product [Rotaria sp. Silwood2]